MTVREQAVARENAEIEASTQRAIAAREAQRPRPMSALESMAARLCVSAAGLQSTLMNTVFQRCTKEEFMALVIVSERYQLDPFLREIYAFPKKGGGIQAIVGYDGWIKIANSHPQFDGYEEIHTLDKDGNIKAIEGILFRKDRGHPTKKMIYLKEFKMNTGPWNEKPSHMLGLRTFCQTVRLGLGIPLGVDGVDNMEIQVETRATVMPSREELDARALEDRSGTEGGVQFNAETGELAPVEVFDDDEEVARALDAGFDPREGRQEVEHGDQHTDGDPIPTYAGWVEGIDKRITEAKKVADLREIEADIKPNLDALPQEIVDRLNGEIAKRRTAFLKGG